MVVETQDEVAPADTELWDGLRTGVEVDFAELFRRHHRLVYNFCFRATASWAEAEDLTQATFTALWRRASEGSVEPLRRDSAAPILLSMARGEVMNSSRGRSRRLRLVERVQSEPAYDDDNVNGWVEQEGAMARVRQVLDRLPEPQRAVVELVWTGLDMTEIAEALDVPVGTVKSRLARARKKLATTEVAHLLRENS